jgi:cycloeucalenol cycloisomerase
MTERFEPFAASAGKRAVERAWLAYTPVWGAVTGCVMLGGFAERWGDVALMIFGVALALGTVLAPLVAAPRDPAVRRALLSMASGIVVLAFGLNYLQTPYFFDVLHMRYGFHATWTLDRNPLFLYLVTIPYFATYSVLACMAVRLVRHFAPRVGVLVFVVVPLALAFLETVLNANPFMTRLFCYDDLPLMLWFGTASYAVSFVLALPVWMAVEEGRGLRWPLVAAAALSLGVVLADTAVLAGLRAFVAPRVTVVMRDAPGRGAGGCLSE